MKLKKYLEMKDAQGIEKNTLRSYRDVLTHLNAWQDLERITKDNLVEYFNKKEWKAKADTTRSLHTIIIKAFFKDSGKPEIIDWIKQKPLKETLSPEQTLTADDINKLLEAADNHYDKALIAFLYDAGCRISEAQSIKWRDLQDTTDGIIVSIPTKKTSAGFRKVILPFASQYIRNLQIYAYAKPDDCIFHISYRAHADRIQKIKKRAGIDKPFTAHKLRHAQATQLVRDGVQEAIIRKKLGWSPTSTMIARYQHNTDEDVINATLEVQGKVKKHHEPVEIKQPEKLSITDAAGHLFKLEEDNAELRARLDKHDADMETMKRYNEMLNKMFEDRVKEKKLDITVKQFEEEVAAAIKE
jgi:integrase